MPAKVEYAPSGKPIVRYTAVQVDREWRHRLELEVLRRPQLRSHKSLSHLN